MEAPLPGAAHARAGTADTWAAVVEVLCEVAPDGAGPMRPISREHRLVEDLGLDSLALARAVVALEARLDRELPPERLHELRSATAGTLLALVDASAPA